MSCLESTTDWYRDGGKDYVKDANGNVNVRLTYAYDTTPSRAGKEDQPFFLTSMPTLVTEKVDILHHAQASLEGKPLALKRNIQLSDGLRGYFSKITDLMHRNLLSWFDDDLVIAKDMVENAMELDNDRGRSGMCSCTCSPTVTSFMEVNEYENLLASLIAAAAVVYPSWACEGGGLVVLLDPLPPLRTERLCRSGRGGRAVFPNTETGLSSSAVG